MASLPSTPLSSMPATFGEMIALRDDITAEQARSKAFQYLFAQAVKTFLTNNKETLDYIDAQVTLLMDTHIEKDGSGNYIILDAGPPVVYQFYSPEDETAYNDEYAALMARTTLFYTPPPEAPPLP